MEAASKESTLKKVEADKLALQMAENEKVIMLQEERMKYDTAVQ